MRRRSVAMHLWSAYIRLNIRIIVATRLWGHVRVEGRHHIPGSGPVLVVSNHLGGSDPPLLWLVFPRRLHFMAMSGLFRFWPMSYLIRSTGGFAVRRGAASRHALRHALALLADGESVAVYPEGERSWEADLEPGKPGVGYLALRSGVRILPVGMAGSERILPRVQMRPKQRGIDICIGEPFSLPADCADPVAATTYIMERIGMLVPEIYRGYLRDQAWSRDSRIVLRDREGRNGAAEHLAG